MRCIDCGHDKLVAFSCKCRGFCPSFGLRRMSQTAAHLVEHVIPRAPVRLRVLSLPIPLRLLLAAQPVLITPVLQVVHRLITRHLLEPTGFKADHADSGAVYPMPWRLSGQAAEMPLPSVRLASPRLPSRTPERASPSQWIRKHAVGKPYSPA